MTGSEGWRLPSANDDRAEEIRTLNDQFRRTLRGGQVLLTQGVRELADDAIGTLLGKVASFDQFSEGNDPYREHDFGAFEWRGQTIFWKIDYYDLDLLMGSPDPSDTAITRRVMTVMLGSEY